MNNFDSAINYLFEIEGLYSNDPVDSGGETYRGISRKSHPEWVGWEIMDNIKVKFGRIAKLKENFDLDTKLISPYVSLDGLAKEFYRKNYWNALSLDSILDKKMAAKLFEIGVHLGTSKAAFLVQQVLKLFYGIKIDGKLGSQSIKFLNDISKKENDLYLNILTIKQGDLYLDIINNHPEQKKFLKGWISRLHMKLEIPT